MSRSRKRLLCQLALLVGVLAASPILAINLAVMGFGKTVFNPLSITRLEERVGALRLYFAHRLRCGFESHPPMAPIAARSEKRHRIPTGLLQALVQVESASNPHRISWAGAMGPGQLMPGTARMLGVIDPFDPETSIDGSARYLKEQLGRFKSVELAASAYNAGPGSVRGRVPRNGETEFYVAKIMAEYSLRRPKIEAAR